MNEEDALTYERGKAAENLLNRQYVKGIAASLEKNGRNGNKKNGLNDRFF
jgi:hypothetical protein